MKILDLTTRYWLIHNGVHINTVPAFFGWEVYDAYSTMISIIREDIKNEKPARTTIIRSENT